MPDLSSSVPPRAPSTTDGGAVAAAIDTVSERLRTRAPRVLTLSPATEPASGPQRRPVRRWAAGAVAALWTAATLALPLSALGLVGWVSDRAAAALTDVVRLPLQVWLAGHLAPVNWGTAAALTIRPLGVTLLVAYLLWRAGTWAGSVCALRTWGAVGRLVAWFAVAYGAIVAGVARWSATPEIATDWRRAALGAAVLAVLFGGAGVLRGSGRGREIRGRLPEVFRVGLDAGWAALLVMLGGGALILTGSLALHFGQVVDLYRALDAGPVGGFLLTLLCLALAPNAAIFATSYAVGPGFALGAGTSISVGGSHVGALPALPLLGATPAGTSVPAYAFFVFAVPTAAGILAGLLAIMRGSRARAERVALRGLVAGPVAGLGLLTVSWLAGGSAGSGHLAVLGPTPWLVAAFATAQVGVLAAVTAWVGAPRGAVAGVEDAASGARTVRAAEADEPTDVVAVPEVVIPATPAEVAADLPGDELTVEIDLPTSGAADEHTAPVLELPVTRTAAVPSGADETTSGGAGEDGHDGTAGDDGQPDLRHRAGA